MSATTPRWRSVLLLSCAAAGSVAAQTHTEASAGTDLRGRAAFQQPIAASTLGALRGGTQTIQNDIALAGTTAHNTAEQVNTGSNTISAGSFANMSGIPVVIQNSGANVLIQNAVILHLQLE
jgi:hypothetical protein